MSKELTPLEALEKVGKQFEVYISKDTIVSYNLTEDYLIIKKALIDYEKVKDIRITARFDLAQVNKEHKAFEIIKENIGLKMSVDEDIGCLYVPITKCFQPLEQNIVIVGYVKGKDKIDLLKEVLL